MSNVALTWAWGQTVSDPSAKLLLIKIADQANDDGICWPSRRTMGRDCGLTPKSISRLIHVLVENGVIEVEARTRPDGGKGSNLYRLLLPGVQGVLPADGEGHSPPVAPLEPSLEPEREASASLSATDVKKPASTRPRDPVWDACEAIWGAPANDVERSRRAKAVKLYRQAFQADGLVEANAEAEIRARYARYSERYDHIALPSDIALASRWSESKPAITITRRY